MIYNKFSDFAKEHIPIDGDKLKIIDVIGKEILITDYNIKSSKYNHNPCLTIQFVLDNKKYIVFTGSNVLADQLDKYKDKIPFLAIIKKIGSYFTFS